MREQVLYNGVRLLDGNHADARNVEILDLGQLPLLDMMSHTGLPIDPSHFEKVGVKVLQDMERLTEEVRDMTGHYVNLRSPEQISDLLFKKIGLKQARPKFTKGSEKKEARESVAEEILVAIQHTHEVIPVIQEFVKLSKLYGTYIVPIPKMAKPSIWGMPALLPNLGFITVPSGRLNSWEPNMLAIPNRTKIAQEMCDGFVAPDGWSYLSVDESQIEPRVCAHCSGDENLIRVYENDEDIYSDFATAAFKIPDKRWECRGPGHYAGGDCDNAEHTGHGWHYPGVHKKKHRFPAKTCVLASLYRVSPKGLLEQMPVVCAHCFIDATEHSKTGCGNFTALWVEDNCGNLINQFYLTYTGVQDDQKRYDRFALRHAYVCDIWGRILHTPAVRCWLPYKVAEAQREAGNLPYQGGANGTIKLTSAQVYDEFTDAGLWEVCKPLLQVHDELIFMVRDDCLEDIAAEVRRVFENCVQLRVPIKAGAVWAKTWGKIVK